MSGGSIGPARRFASGGTGPFRCNCLYVHEMSVLRATFGDDTRCLLPTVFETAAKPDPRQRAGAAAEAQIAHYLDRTFGHDPEVHLFHGLRLVDPDRPEQDSSPGMCRIDHLIVHRWGMIIVESNSAMQGVRARTDGSGGHESARPNCEGIKGVAAPIRQARRQSEFLRALLQRHRKKPVGGRFFGLRSIARLRFGADRRCFMQAPIQLVIAVPYRGMIGRFDSWNEPRIPSGLILSRADLVPDRVGVEVERHRSGSSLSGDRPAGEYGLWSMGPREVAKVARFLGARHVAGYGNSSAGQFSNGDKRACVRAIRTDEAVCGYCAGVDLTARWRSDSYHWRCGDCDRNTAMPLVCAACGAKGHRNTGVRIGKRNTEYSRDCEACGFSETLWTVV